MFSNDMPAPTKTIPLATLPRAYPRFIATFTCGIQYNFNSDYDQMPLKVIVKQKKQSKAVWEMLHLNISVGCCQYQMSKEHHIFQTHL